jgi:DNA-binding GntR family transcriptional regulator
MNMLNGMTTKRPVSGPKFVTKTEEVAVRIRGAISRGVIKAGEPIRIQQWADRLGVSPTPLREALRLLEVEGYVIFSSQKGFQASEFGPGDLLDANRIRRSLQAMAAELAVQRMGPPEKRRLIKRLRQLNARFEQALESGDTGAADRANAHFHRSIFEASSSPILERIRSIVYRITPAAIDLAESEIKRSAESRRELVKEHEAITDALERSDPAAVHEAALRHAESITKRIVSRLTAGKAVSPDGGSPPPK